MGLPHTKQTFTSMSNQIVTCGNKKKVGFLSFVIPVFRVSWKKRRQLTVLWVTSIDHDPTDENDVGVNVFADMYHVNQPGLPSIK